MLCDAGYLSWLKLSCVSIDKKSSVWNTLLDYLRDPILHRHIDNLLLLKILIFIMAYNPLYSCIIRAGYKPD